MRRATHIILGAAVAMPIAASLSPAAAAGAVWMGMVGGGYPDWVDLRSDLSARLKHRGMSHSLIIGVALSLGLYIVLGSVVAEFEWIHLAESEVVGLSIAFASGFLSHILADACTHAGVRPFLPIIQSRVWVLPKPLRGKSNGAIDTVARYIAISLLLLSLWRVLQPYFA